MKQSLLDHEFPQDLKNMSERELELLCYEIREFLLDHVSKTGGHLASNLGVVELTIALHTVFSSPQDKIIWDVGHQSYVHKILTGRAGEFSTLRQTGGLSGFPKRSESVHDTYDSGHSSTSLSAAMGYAIARDLKGEDYSVVSVIGDGALTGGVAYEALNCAGNARTRMIVILNDNEMSIGKNVGGMSQHLRKLRTSHAYLDFKKKVKSALKGIPRIGEGIYSGMESLRDSLKYALVPGAIFEELGFKYFGPVDGHSLHDLTEILTLARTMDRPVLLHIVTKKGKGYRNAENNPGKFHGVGPFDLNTGNPLAGSGNVSYSQVFGNKIAQLAARDENIVAVSAAMIEATGLAKMKEKFPSRTFDAGIAEQHAVAFAAGLALAGKRPVVAIYSTFLQRAYDEILIDVCMQNLPVIFAVDRAGNVGNDGETHHGVFDLSYLTAMPNMTVMAPGDGRELSEMLEYAMTLSGPCAIRYPRGDAADLSLEKERRTPLDGRMEVIREGGEVCLLAVGRMTAAGAEVCRLLEARGIRAGLVNVRFVKPLDREGILTLTEQYPHIVTMEDNVLAGGFYSQVSCLFAERGISGASLHGIGWPDEFIPQGSVSDLMKQYGLDAESIAERVAGFVEGKA
ncbi:1-deoxy-D-xylulose-5-phosphate synthase [Bacilliculturomica massiliensis]|uniref:1-deoxy-D-xylulose-5-phosphate synthase n=1 Tax=Bacilliculturomica massiliensis TaxID=1917867 RepID=UPI001031B5BD|nr:1-deoxy-D-xylulose-5-phosphate synthase [Bacilliculturomica massiliensis]